MSCKNGCHLGSQQHVEKSARHETPFKDVEDGPTKTLPAHRYLPNWWNAENTKTKEPASPMWRCFAQPQRQGEND